MGLLLEIAVFISPVLALLIVPFFSKNNQQAYYIPFGISLLALIFTYWNDPNETRETVILMSVGGATVAGMMSLLLYHFKGFIKHLKLTEDVIASRKTRDKPAALMIFPPILLIMSIYMSMLVFSQWDTPVEILESVGVTKKSAVIELSFLSFYYFALSIGLWMGRQWGWWISGIFCFYRSMVVIKGLIFLNSILTDLSPEEADLSKFKLKAVVKLVSYGICLLYLYRPTITKHFGVNLDSKKKSLLLMVTFSSAILLCTILMHTLMSYL